MIPYKCLQGVIVQSIENKVINSIRGRGRGFCFSRNDFHDFGSPEAIDVALHRLEKKGEIRRIIRGVYDFPRYSDLLQIFLSPSFDDIARAIARKFKWDIQPTGDTALNLLALSTQVPGKYIYFSNGPSKRYLILGNDLIFKKITLKNTGFRYQKSSIIVQAIKSLGKNYIFETEIKTMRDFLTPQERKRVLKDTKGVTAWIYEIIKKICLENI